MKIYKTQKEIKKEIKDGILEIEGDVKFECSFYIEASIKVRGNILDARNINAVDIDARNINALNIRAKNINARNIYVWDIDAVNINVWDIDARNINAVDIDARNINAVDIDAENILYYAFCNIYNSIKCLFIKAKREKHSELICLDGELIIKKEKEVKEMTVAEISEKLGYEIKIIK